MKIFDIWEVPKRPESVLPNENKLEITRGRGGGGGGHSVNHNYIAYENKFQVEAFSRCNYIHYQNIFQEAFSRCNYAMVLSADSV